MGTRSKAGGTIVLMTPPVTLAERYGSLAASGNCVPSLGLLILAALIQEHGAEAIVIDAAAEELTAAECMERLRDVTPAAFAFSITTLSAIPAERFAKIVKERWPSAPIIAGGPHPSAVPEETLLRCPHFDAVATGEGERTILDLLDAIHEEKPDYSHVAGIAYRADNGEIKRTPSWAPFMELDSLPFPAWDKLAGFPERYTPALFKVKQTPSTSFVSSRGCPFSCSFCDTSVFGKIVRAHSAEYMVELFEYLNKQFGIRDITFEDDTFMLDRQNVERFCDLLARSNLKMSWACNSRVNLAKPELLRIMKLAGCWHISYGVESGSQEILDRESKKLTLDQIEDGVRNTVNAGILAKGFFIVGHPGETRETLQATHQLTRTLPFSDISVTCMTPFPGSRLFREAHEYGTFSDDWTKMNLLEPVFVPHGLTADDLLYWQRKIWRDFYFRPRTFLSYTGRILRNPSPRYLKGILQSAWALSKTVFSSNKNST